MQKQKNIHIEKWTGSVRDWGWGCLIMFDKKDWIDIPDDIKIWYGDDYIFKCFLLKKNRFFTLNKNLVKYRIRPNSVSSNRIDNFFDVWKINNKIFKFNFFKNLFCLISISYNSLKKYN